MNNIVSLTFFLPPLSLCLKYLNMEAGNGLEMLETCRKIDFVILSLQNNVRRNNVDQSLEYKDWKFTWGYLL